MINTNDYPADWYFVVDGRAGAYSTKSGQWVETVPAGKGVTSKESEEALVATLRAANVPPYHTVSPYRIVRRLEAAGLSGPALAVLDAPENAVLKARFYTLAGAGGVPADDPDAIALVQAAGADPAVILAPE